MLWQRYPEGHTGSREEAERAFGREAVTKEEEAKMLENLEGWLQSEQWNKADGRYIPQLANWLGRGLWRYPPAKLAVPKGASGQLGEAELEAIRRVLAEKEESPPAWCGGGRG